MFTEETLKEFIKVKKYEFPNREAAIDALAEGLKIPSVITGRSEKQIEYAESCRRRLLYIILNATDEYLEDSVFEAMYIHSLSPEEISEIAKEQNTTAEQLLSDILEDRGINAVYTLMTESDAQKILAVMR